MQDALLAQVGECVTDGCRQTALAGERLGPLPVDLVPGATVVLGRLHSARHP
jgi:hypothetical protein